MRHHRSFHVLAIFAFLVCLPLVSMGGCSGFRDGVAKVIGAPTSEDLHAARDELELAKAEVAKIAEAAIGAEAQLSKLTREDELAQVRRSSMQKHQAFLAQQLATADEASRPMIVAAIREADLLIQETTDSLARIAVTAGEWTVARAKAQAAANQMTERVAGLEAELESFGLRTQEAVASATGAIAGIGQTIGNLGVPGAGAVADQVSGGIGLLLTTILGTGVGALAGRRSKRRAIETVEAERDDFESERDNMQARRDALRFVVATNERVGGIEKIATDPSARAQAKLAVAGNPLALEEFAMAKALSTAIV